MAVYGENLVSNHDFSLGDNGDWTTNGWTINGSDLFAVNTDNTALTQSINIEEGTAYIVEFMISSSGGTTAFYIELGGTQEIISTLSAFDEDVYTLSMTAGSGSLISFRDQAGSNEFVLRNIKVYKTDNAISLSTDYKTYRRFINRTGKKIQLRFSGKYTMRSFKIGDVEPQKER